MVGITVAVGVVVGVVTVAGVTMGRMLARGVDLFPAMAAAVTLLGVDTTGVGLMLAVGGSDVLVLGRDKNGLQSHRTCRSGCTCWHLGSGTDCLSRRCCVGAHGFHSVNNSSSPKKRL